MATCQKFLEYHFSFFSTLITDKYVLFQILDFLVFSVIWFPHSIYHEIPHPFWLAWIPSIDLPPANPRNGIGNLPDCWSVSFFSTKSYRLSSWPYWRKPMVDKPLIRPYFWGGSIQGGVDWLAIVAWFINAFACSLIEERADLSWHIFSQLYATSHLKCHRSSPCVSLESIPGCKASDLLPRFGPEEARISLWIFSFHCFLARQGTEKSANVQKLTNEHLHTNGKLFMDHLLQGGYFQRERF